MERLSEVKPFTTGLQPQGVQLVMDQETAQANERALRTLERAIVLSESQFSLVLVRCSYERLRRSVLDWVADRSGEGQ